jgi:hypothetical protein
MRSLLIAAIACLAICFSQAANPPDLHILAAKAAATVKRAIPGSDGAVQGNGAVVKRHTHWADNIDRRGTEIIPGQGIRIDIPINKGVIFIIRLQQGPYKGPALSKTPHLDPRTARKFIYGTFRSTTLQEFPKSDTIMVVDVWFSSDMDTHMLQQAYAELTRFVASELQH